MVYQKAVDQPPSGGCVLKLSKKIDDTSKRIQPPSGGCVLKLSAVCPGLNNRYQPPSGGCVLKLVFIRIRRGLFGTSRLQAAVC